MNVSEKQIRKIIRKVLSENLILERKSDQYYRLITDVFVELSKPENCNFTKHAPNYPLQHHPEHKGKAWASSYFYRAIPSSPLENILNVANYETQIKIPELIEAINNIKVGQNDIVGASKDRLVLPIHVAIPKRKLVAEKYDELKSLIPELFFKKDPLSRGRKPLGVLLSKFCVAYYPHMGTLFGAMGEDGVCHVNTFFNDFKMNAAWSTHNKSLKLLNYYMGSAPEDLKKQCYNALLDVGSGKANLITQWINSTPGQLVSRVKPDTFESLVVHEGVHFINAVRSGGVGIRTSGLGGFAGDPNNPSTYAASTEELSARAEQFRRDLEIVFAAPKDVNSLDEYANYLLNQSLRLSHTDFGFKYDGNYWAQLAMMIGSNQISKALSLALKPGTYIEKLFQYTLIEDDNYHKRIYDRIVDSFKLVKEKYMNKLEGVIA